jgi:hypothetical protein
MECTTGEVHILKLNDREMYLLKESVQFLHECTINSQEFKTDHEPTVMRAIELEKMCQVMGVEGYECS